MSPKPNDNVDPQAEVDAAWEAEIERRIGEVEAGTAEIVSADEGLREIEEKLRARAGESL